MDKERSVNHSLNPNSPARYPVFIIGEAPGADEDKWGIPFYGRAGNNLRDFLHTMGLDPNKIYITNIVKCRPPKNRDPSREEIDACRVHILDELKKHQPRVVMLLGRSALKLFNLGGKGGIGNIHGKVFEKKLPGWDDGPTFKVIPTYHPAAFLHRANPKLKERVKSDYAFARRVLEAEETPENAYYTAEYKLLLDADEVNEVMDKITRAGLCVWDTESVSLGFKKFPMIMSQFSLGKGKTWIVPFYLHDPDGLDFKLKPVWNAEDLRTVKAALRSVFENPGVQKAAHNLTYDVNVIRQWVGCQVNGWFWDTQVMKHLLDEQPPHGLKFCLNIEFGFGDYEEKIREVVGQTEGDEGKRYDAIPDEIFHPYAATDAEGTYSLLQLYFERLSKKPHLMNLYKEESEPALHNVADMEWAGAKVNMDVVNKLGKEYSSELDRITDECRAISNPKFNPGSPAQVAELLRSMGLGHHIAAPDTASGYSTDKNTLLPLAKDYPIVDLILKRRALTKLKSTYIDNVHKNIDSDGRLRYSFNLFGTTSGRQSNRFYHQIHRIDDGRIKRGMYVMRDMIGEDDDFYFYYADYSQIEYRIFAVIVDDQSLIDLFNRGGNIHTATAADLLGIAEEDVSSFNKTNLGKGFNFGIMFGSKGYQLAEVTYEDPITGDELPMSLTKVQKFVARYLEKHPKIKEYQELVPDLARAQGCMIKSVFGRERRVPELTDENKWTREHGEREIINFTIQSPAAAVPTRTGSKVREWLRSEGVGLDEVRQVTTVHDSLGYGVRKHLIDWFDVGFRKIAERPIPELKNTCFPVNRGWHEKSWARAELGAA